MDHIRKDGFGKIVLAIIPLGKGYYDLAAVESDVHLDLVGSHYVDVTYCRLKRSDPLLAPKVSFSMSDSVSKGLAHVRDQYILEKENQSSNDERLPAWFEEEIGRLNELVFFNTYIDNTPWK